MGLEKDLPPGEQLLACLRPFIGHLASLSLSPKTIRYHVDNLWMPDGEMIRGLHEDPSLRRVAVDRLLRDVIHADGGPLIRNGSEQEPRSFDSTCRKFHRFLAQPQRRARQSPTNSREESIFQATQFGTCRRKVIMSYLSKVEMSY